MDWSFTRMLVFPSILTVAGFGFTGIALVYNFLVTRRIESNHLKHLQDDVTANTKELGNIKDDVASVKVDLADLNGYVRGKLGK